ncbi:hypothetical protein PENTCL1PPCAC_16516, partial [Pristionchus entomophagus]
VTAISTGLVNHISLLLVVIFACCTTLILFVLLKERSYSLNPFFTIYKLTHFSLSFTRIGQGFTHVLVWANRMTAILMPFAHDKFWNSSSLLPLCNCVQLLGAITVGWRAGSLGFHWLRFPQGQLFLMFDPCDGLPNFLRAIFVPVFVIIVVMISLYIII